MIKILIADDHQMFVDGIASLLTNEKDLDVVATCFDGPSVFGMLDQHEINVILLDINLPGMSGIEVAKKIKKDYKSVHILALSMHNELSIVTEILKNGATGYILKNTGRNELITAIRAVSIGDNFYSEDVTKTIMNGVAGKKAKKKQNGIFFPKISRREKQVLALIVKEHTTQEIAEKLFISLKTVESHRGSLLSKLNARNSAGLVRIAIQHHLLD